MRIRGPASPNRKVVLVGLQHAREWLAASTAMVGCPPPLAATGAEILAAVCAGTTHLHDTLLTACALYSLQYAAERVLEDFSTSSEVHTALTGVELVIVPVLNPDGLEVFSCAPPPPPPPPPHLARSTTTPQYRLPLCLRPLPGPVLRAKATFLMAQKH